MKKIIVGFSKSKKVFPVGSWLIRLYQNTPFSHVYIRLPVKGYFPSDKILQASEGLVNHMSHTAFKKKHITLEEFEVSVTDQMYKYLMDYIFHEKSGEDYSLLQNIGIIYVDVLRMFKIRATNPFKSGWNCSEYVAVVLKRIYPNKFKEVRPNTVTPKELHQILTTINH